MSAQDWEQASGAALALFNFGQQEAAKRDLLLVDTKYEFGKDSDGNIMLIDEVGGWGMRARGGGGLWACATQEPPRCSVGGLWHLGACTGSGAARTAAA